MKILFINKTDCMGGAAQVAWDLATELRQMGHEVRFIVRRKFSDSNDVYELKEYLLFRLLRAIFKRDFTVVFSSLRDYLMSNDISFGIEKEIVGHEWIKWADVIHVHNVHGNYFRLENIAKISAVKPVVWTLHDLWAVTGRCAYPFECTGYQNGCGVCPNLNRYQRMISDNSKYLLAEKNRIYTKSKMSLVVPSTWMKEMVTKSVLKNKKIDVVPNGVNTKVFVNLKNKAELRRELNLPEDKKIILFFTYGWKNVEKGWKFVEECTNKFLEVEFVGVGAPISSKDKNVTYVKPIYNQNLLAKYYNAADMLLFPSLSESFGLVPVEAMVCGTPVVAFSVGVISDLIVHKKNGYIAKYADTSDLINGVSYLLNEDINFNTSFDYSVSSMAKKYIKIYENNIS